ncbi:MAG: tetratricopeptide repeat protein [Spirochaetaceae bacterium]|jgi:tetratricopeptide (TPR) repeat protein|nr:tetratricopeptide repeat protein [Spirochaetaceae bacterium]
MERSLREGIRLFCLKRWDMALAEFLHINSRELPPRETVDLTYYLGLCYTKLGCFDDALAHLEQVVSEGTSPFRVRQCRITLAYIYTMTKRAEMAEFEIDKILKSGYESATVYAIMAYALWSQKKYNRAIELYRKILSVDINNATALNGLGYILIDTGTDIEHGLKLCKKAVAYKPNNAAYLDSLAWACFKKGEANEAKTLFRRALELAPKQTEIRIHQRIALGDNL